SFPNPTKGASLGREIFPGTQIRRETMAESARIAVARRMFERWGTGFDELSDSFRDAMAPDAFFQQTKTPDLSGIDQIVEFLDTARKSGVMETIDVELVNMFDDGRF